MNLPDLTGLESIFDLITKLLSSVAEIVRSLITEFAPSELQSTIMLIVAFVAGYWLRDKTPIPAWVIIGIAIFFWLKYI